MAIDGRTFRGPPGKTWIEFGELLVHDYARDVAVQPVRVNGDIQ